jgi:hypothetical protein
MRDFIEKDLPEQRRARGTSGEVLQKLTEFDELTVLDKLDCLYKALRNTQCENGVCKEFK